MSKDKDSSTNLKWLDTFLKHASKQGASSVVIVALVFVFVIFSSVEQKRCFIDTWILFKAVTPESVLHYRLVIGILFLLLIVQFYFTRMIIKLKNDRISELAEDRNNYQKILLDRNNLNSSKK